MSFQPIKIKEWETITKTQLNGFDKIQEFQNYLNDIWTERNRYSDIINGGQSEEEEDEEEDANDEEEERKQNQQFFKFNSDNTFKAGKYVGVVQYEGLRIQVYPKILKNINNGFDDENYQKTFLYWLTYCTKIEFPFSLAEINDLDYDFLEFLISLFASFTEETLAKQPFQTYQQTTEETAFIKGRLAFDDYVKHNLITGKWQNFHCTYEPFAFDNQFNRIVKYVSKRLLLISKNKNNIDKLDSILFHLNDVSNIPCTATDCGKVKLNPLYDDHKQIINLCKLFLSNKIIDMTSENSNNFSFLFRMEYIFEKFISGFINEHWKNRTNSKTDKLAYWNDKKTANRVFTIKNDIYIDDPDPMKKLIIDAKYKEREKSKSEGKATKAGVMQSDLYQMVGYSIRRNCRNILLMYPFSSNDDVDNSQVKFIVEKRSSNSEIPNLNTDEDINIDVKTVDVLFEEFKSKEEADEIMKDRIMLLNPIFSKP